MVPRLLLALSAWCDAGEGPTSSKSKERAPEPNDVAQDGVLPGPGSNYSTGFTHQANSDLGAGIAREAYIGTYKGQPPQSRSGVQPGPSFWS